MVDINEIIIKTLKEWPQFHAGFDRPVGDPGRTTDELVKKTKIAIGGSIGDTMNIKVHEFDDELIKKSADHTVWTRPWQLYAVIFNPYMKRLVTVTDGDQPRVQTWGMISTLPDYDPRRHVEVHEYPRLLAEALPGELRPDMVSVVRGFELSRGPSCVIVGHCSVDLTGRSTMYEFHMNICGNKLYMVRHIKGVVQSGHVAPVKDGR